MCDVMDWDLNVSYVSTEGISTPGSANTTEMNPKLSKVLLQRLHN